MHLEKHHLIIASIVRQRRAESRAAVAAARRAVDWSLVSDRDPRERARSVLGRWSWVS
jgi:hypothetical protein